MNHYEFFRYDEEITGKMYFPLFNKEIEIFCSTELSDQHIKKCIDAVQKIHINNNIIDDMLKGFSTKNKIEYDWTDDECSKTGEINRENMLDLLEPDTIYFYQPKNDEIAFCINFFTPFEVEHGICWKVVNNKTVYIGSADYILNSPLDELNNYIKNYAPLYYNRVIPDNIKLQLEQRQRKFEEDEKKREISNELAKKNVEKNNVFVKLLKYIKNHKVILLIFVILGYLLFNLIHDLYIRKNYESTFSSNIINKKCTDNVDEETRCYGIIEYIVEGKTYRTKQELVPNYNTVTIYYNSSKPSVYFIDNHYIEKFTGLIIGLIIIAIILFVFLKIKKHKKNKNFTL